MREAPRVSSSHFCSEVRERLAEFSAGTKQCSGQVALMPGPQAPESIFSPLPLLLNSLIPSPWQGEVLFINLTTGVPFSVFLYPLDKKTRFLPMSLPCQVPQSPSFAVFLPFLVVDK